LQREEVPDDFEPDSPYAAVLSIPLLLADEVIGILNLGAYTAGILIEKHVRLMSIVADQLAVSIERLEYIAAIEAKNQELARAHKDVKTAQEKIVAEEKLTAVCELAASVNHEINNPLSVILGHVQCLGLELADPDARTRTRLERIEQAAMRIGEVNRNLLRIDKLIPHKHLSNSDPRLLDLDPSVSG
jgi:K+-sensing histidine kinase KdpD